MKAYILIKVNAGAIREVVRRLRSLEGVAEADMTLGPYDVIATVEADGLERLGQMVAGEIQPIPGVLETLTCLAVGLE